MEQQNDPNTETIPTSNAIVPSPETYSRPSNTRSDASMVNRVPSSRTDTAIPAEQLLGILRQRAGIAFTPLELSEAISICGKLSKPSKMPGPSYSIPAVNCIVGGILRGTPGTTCSKCYARRGNYNYPVVQKNMRTRFASLRHPQWAQAIATQIKYSGCLYFRWHDSGDLQGMWHLHNIIQVAEWCPDVYFWLPTREAGFVRKNKRAIPTNLIIRISTTMIDAAPPVFADYTSGVVSNKDDATCRAFEHGNKCGICRKCWDMEVKHVTYHLH